METDGRVYVNGIDGTTGDYLLPPMLPHQIAQVARGETWDEKHLKELKWRKFEASEPQMSVQEGIDPKNLGKTGWGVIFAHNADPAVKDRLGDLLRRREQQAGPLYQEYSGERGYHPGESKQAFLARFGAGPGPVDPELIPYYLLIVGDPNTIPYSFQYQLDVQYAVGRIYFDDPDGYGHYARSVVAFETAAKRRPRQAIFFGVQNPDDPATGLSATELVDPLANSVAADQKAWTVKTILKEQATKARLGQVLGGPDTPSLLFTASHGMGFPNGDPQQLPDQGALLCQDWPGRIAWKQPIPNDFYFAASDVSVDATLQGLIAFHFACYGAGTPQIDDFTSRATKQRVQIAPHDFLARLPQRLLGHPKGGALAVIGHVERAWTYSFLWGQTGRQLGTFKSTLKRLMEGHPIGSATEYLNLRYAELSTDLREALDRIETNWNPDDKFMGDLWTSNTDARNFVVLGDPAVHWPDDQGTTDRTEP